jgi:hypothetical protein
MMEEKQPDEEELALSKAVLVLLEECRMVLPGIQALFGFQMVAVFNSRFAEALSRGQQAIHLIAIFLTAVAIALIMTPAAYHRQTHPEKVTRTFLKGSTRLVLWSMPPLLLALCSDFYLVGSLIIPGIIPLMGAAALGLVFFSLWFVLPSFSKCGLKRG